MARAEARRAQRGDPRSTRLQRSAAAKPARARHHIIRADCEEKTMRVLKWALMAVALLSASLVQAQALEKKKITIAVGGQSLLYYLPLTIAERKGYFKNEGLD